MRDGDLIVLGQADARRIPLADESVHVVITSPPFYGLRDYGTGRWEGGDPDCEHKVRQDAHIESSTLGGGKATVGHQREGYRNTCAHCGARRIDSQIGLEQSPGEYVAQMVAVFREVKRVLRKDGTVWLNLGDSYARAGGWSDNSGLDGLKRGESGRPMSNIPAPGSKSQKLPPGLKEKDLVGIPWRVALALQADGWFLRSDIIWAKGISFCPTYSGSVMPESVRDRPTQSYEHVFLLAKSKTYYYDNNAVREPVAESSIRRISQPTFDQQTGGEKDYKYGINPNRSARAMLENFAASASNGRNLRSVWTIPDDEWAEFLQFREWKRAQAGLRDTWTINPKPSRLAHYAAFPPALVEPMVLAGTSAKGCCPKCGAGWVRVTERTVGTSINCPKTLAAYQARGGTGMPCGTLGQSGGSRIDGSTITTGWRPGCDCLVPTCHACGSVVDYNYEHKQSITKARMPSLRGRHDGEAEELEVLLPNVLCQGAAGATRQGMPPMPPDVPAKKQTTIPLQSGMFKEMDALASEHDQGMDEDYSGLHNDLEPGSSSGNQGGLHNGASLGNGTGTRAPASEIRGGSSQECQEGRQSPGESGASAEKRTRLYEASDVHSDMPTLRHGIPLSGQCPHCEGELVLAPYPPQPCVVLDCFGGTMTVGQVCAKHGRHFVGLDLKREYVEMGRERCADTQMAMAL